MSYNVPARLLGRTFAVAAALSLLAIQAPAVADPASTTQMPVHDGSQTSGALRLPALFGDNMVIQRDTRVPVWGWAGPGTKVSVVINGKSADGVTNSRGKWRVELPAMPAGGPSELTVTAGREKRTFANVMLGEVWVASGQSNMDMSVAQSANAKQETAGADDPRIRLFKVPRLVANTPEEDTVGGKWVECTSATVGGFSAVAYFFGRDISGRLNVPVGLIQTSWGGTPAESWTSEEGLAAQGAFRARVAKLDHTRLDPTNTKRKYQQAVAKWGQVLDGQDAGSVPGNQWSSPDHDDSEWQRVSVPGAWEDSGLPAFDGVVWFRTTFDVPAALQGKNLTLNLGPIDDADITWVNGTRVGATDNYAAPRHYEVPASLLKPGRNTIAVRVLDTGGAGGFTGKAADVCLQTTGAAETTPIPLAGKWAYKVGVDLKNMPPLPQMPGSPYRLAGLFNGMVAPLIPYAIRGVIWYQGEANAATAYRYRTVFPAMIRDWRSHWAQGDFPFLFVQLANFMEAKPEPADSEWAELREAQLMTLSVPRTGMATAIDIGEAKDIHPRNKQEVGRRLALAARAIAYGEQLVHSGPIYRAGSLKIEGGNARVSFDHAGGGLEARGGGPLKWFAIAGADRRFVWADARIDGDSVVVSSPNVASPVAVRYDWSSNPDGNLANKEGLPASPFRTDNWPGLTDKAK